MSTPRQIVPGATWSISRRTAERRFFLLPTAYVTQVFLYCLGYAAAECGMLVHAFEVLSNHFHLKATDPERRLPEFLARLDGLLARALNAHRGRWESFFAPGSCSAVRLETPDDMLSFSRPKGGFFDPNGCMPPEVSLTLAPPPGLGDMTAAQLDELLRQRVNARETETRAQFRAEGRSFLGMDEVMRRDPNDRPATPEPRRTMNPHLAAGDPERRIEAIRRLQEFRSAYRAAWLRWKAGNRRGRVPRGNVPDARPARSLVPPVPAELTATDIRTPCASDRSSRRGAHRGAPRRAKHADRHLQTPTRDAVGARTRASARPPPSSERRPPTSLGRATLAVAPPRDGSPPLQICESRASHRAASGSCVVRRGGRPQVNDGMADTSSRLVRSS